MDITLTVLIAAIVLLLVFLPLLFFYRRSTDISLEGDRLILRYPFKKEEINLINDLKSWHLQEAYFLRLGKIYTINLELNSGKWRHVSSRFNAESFDILFTHLEKGYSNKRKTDKQ